MDSSSDGSFAWTDASDNSTNSETMAKPTQNLIQSGDESESGKTYKKKLQQRLLSTHESESEVDKTDKRKRRFSEHPSDSVDVKSPKRKKIKTEPESDLDTKKIKKKHKSLETSQYSDRDPFDENHLNLKVKNEQQFAVPSPVSTKKLKKKVADESSASLVNGECNVSEENMSSTSLNTDAQVGDEDTYAGSTRKPKKKRKKSKSKHRDSDNDISNSNTYNEESICNTGAESQLDLTSDEPHNDISSIHSDPSFTNDIPDVGEPINSSKRLSKSPKKVSLNSHRKSKMSERIRFEDEDDSDVQTKSAITPVTKNKSKLKSFLETSYRLRPLSGRLPIASVLSRDDDVWLVKCPKDVNTEDFHGKKWTLANKCKIKLDGQTYEGDLDDNPSNVTILSNDQDRTVIKHLQVHGCVRLRRRIPKAHIRDDNIIVNNQTNFIPLPETKCRHPLFGLHYKKAIKLPSAVAERLRASHNEAIIHSSTGKMKKKRDKNKCDANTEAQPKLESTAMQEELPLAVNTSTKKKKKKRKHSNAADEEMPQHKRIKHDPECAEVWESEKAIEENLFNF